MTTFDHSPRLIRGGLALLDPRRPSDLRVIVLQYNPHSVSRTLKGRAAGEGKQGGGDRSQAMRLIGPPVETFKIEAELDATDLLESGDPQAIEHGIQPQLAALEAILYPSSGQLLSNRRLARSGTLEIVPMQAPLCLFIWGESRIVPVRMTEFSVTEEAFDTALNPIRAKVSLGMRVLSVDDLGFDHEGGSLFMAYLEQKEHLSSLLASGDLGSLGIGGLP